MPSTKVAVLSPNAPAPSPLMSQGIVSNGMLYCSGSLGIDPKTGKFVDGDASDRTVQALRNLEQVLIAGGSDLSKVVKVTIFLSSMQHYAKLNEGYAKVFVPGVGVQPLSPEGFQRVYEWACANDETSTLQNLYLATGSTLKNNPKLGKDPLYCACRKGDNTLINILLDAGVSLIYRPSSAYPTQPLAVAALHDHLPTIELLLSRGAKWQPLDFEGMFQLIVTMARYCTRALVKGGLNLQEVDDEGNGFLHHACQMQNRSAVTSILEIEVLLDLGLDINKLNKAGRTPLYSAIRAGAHQRVNFLLSQGADPNAGSDGNTPLHAFMKFGKDPYQAVRSLLTAGATLSGKAGLEILKEASHKGLSQSAKALIEAWNRQNKASDQTTRDLLLLAICTAGDVSQLENSLHTDIKGVNVDCNIDGMTPLIAAVNTDQINMIKFLIPKISSFDTLNKDGHTALHIAIRGKSEDAIRLLLPHTTRLNAFDSRRRFPLSDAVEFQSPSIVALLLDRMMQANEPNTKLTADIVTPALSDAIKLSKIEMVQLSLTKCKRLLQTECRSASFLFDAIVRGQEDIAIELLKWGTSPNGLDKEGRTPLMKAVMGGLPRVVKALFYTKGLVMTTTSPLDETALTLAVTRNRPEFVRLFLGTGLSPKRPVHFKDHNELRRYNESLTNGNGAMPRDFLFFEAVRHGLVEIVEILIPYVDVEATSNVYPGRTALHLAADGGHVAVIDLLVDIGKARPTRQDANGMTALDILRQRFPSLSREIVEKLSRT
ncbi:ankyrin repeat-containing domain protein [Aspergillus karnatakaensis]|uniref:ankyrin repeat-containing domain protein n=1 Tax=Aspergillus karnatakaensis TaxID=1810916 RepID=UPI003CCD6028